MLLTYEKGKADKIHISLDGSYAMTVDATFWYGLGIKNKTEISEEELARLKGSVNSRRAFNKAVELLSRREHSRKELVDKLKQRSYDDVAEAVADELEALGYLNDERFARMYARELKQRKSMGRKRIAAELYNKGISRDIAREVLEDMQEDTPEEIGEIIRRKYSRCMADEKGRTRTFNGLVRLGYSFSDIKKAMKEFDNSDISDIIDLD